MPQLKNYKTGSIIYFEGEKKNNFAYLLKSGKLTRTKLSLESAAMESSQLTVGEFFGIKAGLGIVARDETIRVVSDATIYIFTPQEFLNLMQKNVSIIFKMLRAFSNELRKIHHAIENILAIDSDLASDQTDSNKLRGIGSYYFKQKAFAQARYAFKAYLKHYPKGQHVDDVNEQLSLISDIIGDEPGPSSDQTESTSEDGSDLFHDSPDMLEKEHEDAPVKTHFNRLLEIYKTHDFEKSAELLGEIESQVNPEVDKSRFIEKLYLLKAKIIFYSEEYDMAIEGAKEFVKIFPSSIWVSSALLVVAESFIKQENETNAKAVFSKIIASPGPENIKSLAKDRINELS